MSMANLMEKSKTRQRPFRFVPVMLQGVWFLIQMMLLGIVKYFLRRCFPLFSPLRN